MMTHSNKKREEKRQKILWEERQVKRATNDSYRANRPRLEKIVSEIRKLGKSAPDGPARVLNIGIGDARLEGMLLKHGFEICVLDPSESIVEFTRQKYGLDEATAKCGWSQDIPFEDAFFDFVVMTEVVEHLDRDTMLTTFSEIVRVLKSGGYFVGTVPDNEDLNRFTSTCPNCGEVSHRVGHEQSFTAQSLKGELAPYFSTVSIRSFRGMYMNRTGILYHHWIDLPFKLVRPFRPGIRVPHQIVFNLFFICRNA
jgi:SAM-dependent methyltransferase